MDAALDQLPRPDREVLLLRFWQQQDHRSIGTALGSTEDAARKRIARALEKLRSLLRRRGVLLTAALLTQFLTDHAIAAVPSSIAATLPGAAWRQATTSGPITAVSHSLIRRFWPATAAALVITGGLWTAVSAGWFTSSSSPKFSAIPATAKAPKAATSKEITLHFTIADVPAGTMAHRLLSYEPGGNDAALFTEVHQLANTSGKLVEFALTSPSGKSRTLERSRPYSYSDRWTWDEKLQRPHGEQNEIRNLGTNVEAIATRLTDGPVHLQWAVSHDYAEPVFHAWPISLREPEENPGSSVDMEDFYNCQLRGSTSGLTEGKPRLRATEVLNPRVMPEARPGPRVLLVFVTLATP